MRASKVHYFYAQDWPARIWLTSFSLGFAVVAAYLCWPLIASFSSWAHLVLVLICVCVAGILGRYAGTLLGLPVIGPLYFERSLDNGEPFQEGDLVQIIVGPHRDKTVRVKSTFEVGEYAGAHRICVDLGQDVSEEDSLFTSLQILRIEAATANTPRGRG